MHYSAKLKSVIQVMPRKRHVSRNLQNSAGAAIDLVMPRKRHVSRNYCMKWYIYTTCVMPRKRHVSRNLKAEGITEKDIPSCLARGM